MEGKRTEELERENRQMKDRIESLEQELKYCRLHLEDLSKRADLDYLTGVLNREGICRLISGYLKEKGETGALCFLDLDNFKQINDPSSGTAAATRLCARSPRRCRKALEEAIPWAGLGEMNS